MSSFLDPHRWEAHAAYVRKSQTVRLSREVKNLDRFARRCAVLSTSQRRRVREETLQKAGFATAHSVIPTDDHGEKPLDLIFRENIDRAMNKAAGSVRRYHAALFYLYRLGEVPLEDLHFEYRR